LEGITVKDIMSKNVITVYLHSNVTNAIRMMAEHDIGSVVVIDSAGPQGVFAERDLLSRVLAAGKNPEGLIMMEVLSPLFAAIDRDASLAEAAKRMMATRSRLMVFEGGELQGIVTATDIIRFVQMFTVPLDLSRVITRRVALELPETPLRTVVQDMEKLRVGSVLVGDDRTPYGIFTERDLLRKVLARKVSLDAVVGEYVTVPLVTAPIVIDGVEAAKTMVANHIKRLPLKEGDRITGMVTARDIVEALAHAS
jgi:CBS domain-containing protein